MKRILVVILCISFFCCIFSFPEVKAAITDIPMPVKYCASAKGQDITISWEYSCPSGFKCYIEIDEDISGSWNKIGTFGAGDSPKVLNGQPYGMHKYRMRAKLEYGFITLYSSYTPSFYAYVLKTPIGLTVSVNPDFLFSDGNPYLTLKWNPVDAYSTNIIIWRKAQGASFFTTIAKLSPSATSYDDTTVQYNSSYTYDLQVVRKDDTSIQDDSSAHSISVSKLTLPAPPTNYKANAIDKTVYMSWYHSKICDGYKIYRWRTSPVIGWFLVGTIDKNTLSYSTTVPDYGVYTFKVVSFNASGDSSKAPTKDVFALKAPTGLTATALSSTVIKLTWDPLDSNATKVRVSYSNNGTVYTSIGAFDLPISYITVSSLTPNTQYWFKIAVNRDSNESHYSNVATTKTLPSGTPPAVPSSASATALNCGRVELNWQDNSDNEDGFRIERKEGSGVFSEIGAVTSNMTVLTDTAVSPGKTYTYRIRSYNAFGHSDYSNETVVVVPPCGPVPNTPSNLTAKLTSVSEALIKWQDNSDNESGFKLERKKEGGSYSVIKTLSPNATETTDTGFLPGTKYYYRIRAFNDYGYSEYSNEISIKTPSETDTPSTPSTLTATATSCNQATLNWIDNSINETSFIVERKLEGESYTVIAGTVPPNTTTYADNNVEEGKKYYYRVKASNVNGDSDYSNEVSVIIPPCGTPPAAPSNLTASPISENKIKLTFKDNSDNEDGFKIERKEPGGTYELIAVLEANSTTHTDSGLNPNTIYYYRVCAFNSFGASNYSNEANATTLKLVEKIVIRLYIDKTTYYVNDVPKTMDVAPIIKESRTLLPIRYVAEALGADVGWDATEQKVTITFKGTTIELWIGKNTARVNGEYKLIDPTNTKVTPVIIPPGRTMLPIRFIAENLGCEVEWDGALREVKITYPAK